MGETVLTVAHESKLPCYSFLSTGACQFGKQCIFRHEAVPLDPMRMLRVLNKMIVHDRCPQAKKNAGQETFARRVDVVEAKLDKLLKCLETIADTINPPGLEPSPGPEPPKPMPVPLPEEPNDDLMFHDSSHASALPTLYSPARAAQLFDELADESSDNLSFEEAIQQVAAHIRSDPMLAHQVDDPRLNVDRFFHRVFHSLQFEPPPAELARTFYDTVLALCSGRWFDYPLALRPGMQPDPPDPPSRRKRRGRRKR